VQNVSLLATACLLEFARERENGRKSALRRQGGDVRIKESVYATVPTRGLSGPLSLARHPLVILSRALETFAAFVGKSPTRHSFARALEHWHGAATRVGRADTALPHRQHC
jgi:hypothetical protein